MDGSIARDTRFISRAITSSIPSWACLRDTTFASATAGVLNALCALYLMHYDIAACVFFHLYLYRFAIF